MPNSQIIYWSQLQYEDLSLNVAATEKGLCYVQFAPGDIVDLQRWSASRMTRHELVHDQAAMQAYTRQLTSYLQGKITEFTVPLDMNGTPFQLEVWAALSGIPFGQTRSYSEIAEAVSRPSAMRAVGSAIGANPILIAVPCHRVIGKSGALTGYRGGLYAKTLLLQLESKGSSLCSPA
jgi:methylated-DNA-[protein]-cysteine S-methyltransferase